MGPRKAIQVGKTDDTVSFIRSGDIALLEYSLCTELILKAYPTITMI